MLKPRILRSDELAAAGTQITVVPYGVPSPAAEPTRILRRDVAEAKMQAEALLHEARETIDARRKSLEAEVAAKVATFEQECSARAEERVASRLLQLEKAYEKRGERQNEESLAMALLLAERLLGQKLALEPALMKDLSERVRSEVRAQGDLRIETAVGFGQEVRDELQSHGISGAVVTESPELSAGDLLLHTPHGSVDARIRLRLERLRPIIEAALRETS